MRGKPKVGDILEVTLRDGTIAYLQKIDEEVIGDVARVLQGRFGVPVQDPGELVREPHEYLIYAFLGRLVNDGHARKVGNWPVPEGTWSGLRLSSRYDKSGAIEAWVVTDGRMARDRLAVVPAALRQALPVWEVGDSLHVIDTLAASREGGLDRTELDRWRREHGLGDTSSEQAGDHAEPEPVRHFALFPHRAKLAPTIEELGRRGFSSSIFTGPEVDGQLLVISTGPSAPGFIDDQWDRVEEVVTAAGGEYDGWEASVPGS